MAVEPANKRVRWQCRRGTRELDQLLLSWFDAHFATANKSQKSAFCALLELPDPELAGYLLGAASPADTQIADVVNAVRKRTSG